MSDTAVLVIDMLNDYRHPDAQQLADNVAPIIDQLVDLIADADHHDDADLIYVNDNHGDFAADHRAIISAALAGERPDLVEPLVPPPGCRIITKVRHSVF
jgi:nicotinamidase-related amidase